MESSNCPDYDHLHCNYCDSFFIEMEGEYNELWKKIGEHIRDDHPDVWKSDEAMRREAVDTFGVEEEVT